MPLTPLQTIIIIIVIALGTMITRFTPFILFPESKELPPIITFLGKTLPPSMMGLLVVYSLKSVTILQFPYGIPEAISLIVITILHLWKRNVLLSIGIGTLLYMILIQYIFVL
ncbi:branched-chain amino acid transporter permease [Anaerorhabdus sp.]|uniref:branched-chain amino acid transporter permease n=1 Tax=Anaerorhabdus sp. TaxID=1872524 RepID=UPI002FC7C3E2